MSELHCRKCFGRGAGKGDLSSLQSPVSLCCGTDILSGVGSTWLSGFTEAVVESTWF